MAETAESSSRSPDTEGSGRQNRLQRYRDLQFSEEELAVILLTPVVSFLFAVSFYPIFDTIVGSLHTGYVLEMNPRQFVGLENYRNLFGEGPYLDQLLNGGGIWNALRVSLIYTFVSVPIELALGLGIALLLNRDFKGKYFAQAAILFPWAIPTVINARIWAWMFNGQYGVINDLLMRVGILETQFPFLAKPDTALIAMLFITIWKTSSFMALILLAGLQSIPDHLYEAARMDGASRLRQFRDITLPLLKPTLLVALIFRTLPAFQAFGLPFGLTGGGPSSATTTLVLFDHQLTFNRLNFGEGAATATLITLIAAAIAMIYVQTLYEPEVR
ncbi:carbohydrate ABC transporter permease [Halohasta litorea]|uniref:Carbohydrate ABC transporter permease n=1 Tax=Halohasta litorea TaxID=869891 RepID=A0ABD6DBI9_9EURY|nr:sugar ABC transporter permease [Halohasta litorea]MEA1931652.1 sugar ABC transporter permease [Euryarchaeota archaeon]